MPRTARNPRYDNRRSTLRDAAAHLFRESGFHATSMRDISRAAGILPGSIYYHFPSKEELFLEVYQEGVQRITEHVQAALASEHDPHEQLRAAAVAHLEMLLERSDYAQVVIRVLPRDVPDLEHRLTVLRDGYEAIFRDLIDALGPATAVERRRLRLLLLGALNWAQFWYQPGGETPAEIATGFLSLIRHGSTASEDLP